MHPVPREKLAELVRAHGDELLQDPRRVRAFLYDTCPGFRRELTVLVAAAEEDVPVQIRRSSDPVALRGGLERLTAGLEEHRGLNREAARWAVEAWAWALGAGPVPANEQATDAQPPPKPKPQPPLDPEPPAREPSGPRDRTADRGHERTEDSTTAGRADSEVTDSHKTVRRQMLAGGVLLVSGLLLPLSSFSSGGSFRLVPDSPELAFAAAVTAVAALLAAAALGRPERLPPIGGFAFGLGLYGAAFFLVSLGFDLTDEDVDPAVGVFLAIGGGILLTIAGLRGLQRTRQYPAPGWREPTGLQNSGHLLAVAGAALLVVGGFVPWGEDGTSTFSGSLVWALIPGALIVITVTALMLSRKPAYRVSALWLLMAGAYQAVPIVLLLKDGAWPLGLPAGLITLSGLIAYLQWKGSAESQLAPGPAEHPPANPAP